MSHETKGILEFGCYKESTTPKSGEWWMASEG